MSDSGSRITMQQLRREALLEAPASAGSHFKAYLDRQRITAAKAASDLHVAKSTVTRFINNESSLSVEMAANIFKVYGISINLMFKLDAAHKAYLAEKIAMSIA
ncbi:XRE family transcriptional regulator [Pseudidiomarina aestuarii]|uniref:XRE family transcriptional regulator n=1 Tax=Pseudidiomarina aestuarii TaxID=624146 RepID=A0A2T4CU08_9GAMM|nr:XRE family transcriptional regulator [Pseudidiomarina aestuarii]PTB83242.1 XRE family transcriptional regulator [Pseudidiomarina aestuarii]PTB85050.1 XRE family transcriptional regulator [Pseudidiomarina aestuarii]PTB88507.1 XRE family transcriptional regulator [Pseudidiomarina aestuarii]